VSDGEIDSSRRESCQAPIPAVTPRGAQEFVEDINRNLQEKIPFWYEVPLGEISSAVSSRWKTPRELFYGMTRGRQGAWGRAVVVHLGRKVGGFALRAIAEHFHRDPVVKSLSFFYLISTRS
jgi:chromosomal replication initiation ATPase DnaA